jgi:hypothetical protein
MKCRNSAKPQQAGESRSKTMSAPVPEASLEIKFTEIDDMPDVLADANTRKSRESGDCSLRGRFPDVQGTFSILHFGEREASIFPFLQPFTNWQLLQTRCTSNHATLTLF